MLSIDQIDKKIAEVQTDRNMGANRLKEGEALVKSATGFIHKCDGALEVLQQLRTQAETPSDGAEGENDQSQQTSES